MINPQWFELPISQTNFYGPKDVWPIEVWQYKQTEYSNEDQNTEL